MAHVQFVGDPDQLARLERRAAAAKDALRKTHPVMRKVATFLDSWVQRNFRTQGKFVGGWTPFVHGGRVTTKAKASGKSADGVYVNTAAKLLMDTGALRLSFLPFATSTNAGVGSDLPYSEIHEKGTKTTPRRRMLPEEGDVKVQVREILENHVRVSLNKGGF